VFIVPALYHLLIAVCCHPQAKSFMLAVAGERLAKAMWVFPLMDLRRGWQAWVMAVRHEERKFAVDTYVRFQGMRYLATSLAWLLRQALSKKWVLWRANAQTVSKQLRDIAENNAAVKIQTRARGMLARMRVRHLKKVKKYEALYHGTIELQRIFRGKPVRWRFQAWQKEERRRKVRVYRRVSGRARFGWPTVVADCGGRRRWADACLEDVDHLPAQAVAMRPEWASISSGYARAMTHWRAT
jgi:hypothetical protein